MRIKLRKRVWDLLFTNRFGEGLAGNCDPPGKGAKMRIKKNLTPQDEFETIIHECLHACFWDLCEEAVSESGHDITQVLWDLGYRKQP